MSELNSFAHLGTQLTVILMPFLPFLTKLAEAGTEEFGKVVGAHGGQSAWELGKVIWTKLTGRPQHPRLEELGKVAKALALLPDDEHLQKKLASLLSKELELDGILFEELNRLVEESGTQRAHTVGDRSRIEGLYQELEKGTQEVKTEGTDSPIIGVSQIQKKS